MPDPSDQDDLALLESSVREAGAIARKFYDGDTKSWNKAGGSPVTEADLAVDAFLKQALLRARPDYGWLSEESPDDRARLDKAHVFVVDPIDGTVAFLKRRPHFTICAAVARKGRPVAGIVFNPLSGECFSARAGGGAFLNGARLQVGDRDEIAGSRLLAPRSLFQGWPVEIESFSSVAYRVVLVAAARHDAAVSLTPKRDWDLAAADLVLREAGGRLTDARGETPIYNRPAAAQRGIVAAGPRLQALLLARISPDATKITWPAIMDSP